MEQVKTKYGWFTPCSDASDLRKKYRCPVEYYHNGNVRSIYLQEPSVVKLDGGEYQAELITFYEDGSIKRLFPLYGQISSYWSVEDESQDAPEYVFTINGRQKKIRPQCIYFYPSGKIRSITIWPGDSLTVDTSKGPVTTNLGVELYEDSAVRSIEPVVGTVLETRYGNVKPFMVRKHMMHSEGASMAFDENGELISLATLNTSVEVQGQVYKASGWRAPLVIFFTGDGLCIKGPENQDIWVDTRVQLVRFR